MSVLSRLASQGIRARTTAVATRPTSPNPVDPRSRVPVAANLLSSWSTPGQPQLTSVDAQAAVNIGYFGYLYSYRCAVKIAQTIAGLPFRAGPDQDKPEQYDTNAPLARLLGPPPGSPNPGTSARALWRWSIVHFLMTGRWAWETTPAVTDRNTIAGLWPLPSMWISPIEAPPGSLYPWASFRYQTPRDRRDMRVDQVFYAWRPSLEDWKKPESPVQAMKMSLDLARAMDQYAVSFMRNNMSATTLVVTPPFKEDELRQAFQDQFVSSMAGASNAGNTYFTEITPGSDGKQQAVQVERIGVAAKDAQFIEIRNAVRDEVCDGWGVPRSILGQAAERTYENADQEHRNYWDGTILEWIAEIQDPINSYLAPRLGQESGWFDLSRVKALQPGRIFMQEPASALVAAGIVSEDEVREDLGLAPANPDAAIAAPPLPAIDDTPGAGGGAPAAGGSKRAIEYPDYVIEAPELESGLRYDVTPFGSGKNWVTKVGGLPLFIRAVAHALVRAGHTESEAIERAVGIVQDWAHGHNPSGKGSPSAKTIAKAQAAIAEWEAKKAKSHASSRDAVYETGSAGTMLPVGNKGRGGAPHRFVPADGAPQTCTICGKHKTSKLHKTSAETRTAQPDFTGSAMIAVYPPLQSAKQIAVDGGLPAHDLHVTLASLDPEMTAEQAQAAHAVVQSLASEHGTLSGSVGGVGQFPEGDDGIPHYAPVDVPNLAELRDRLIERLTAAGVPVAQDHGFTPHMTLIYAKPGQAPPEPVPITPVTFGRLSFVHGPSAAHHPLAGTRHRGNHGHLPITTGHARVGTDAHKLGHYRLVDRHARATEADLQASLQGVFRQQAAATINRLRGNRGRQMLRAAGYSTRAADPADREPPNTPPPTDPPSPPVDAARIFDTAFWVGKTRDAINGVFDKIAAVVPSHVGAQIGVTAGSAGDQAAVRSVREMLNARTNRIAGQVTQQTYDEIIAALNDGVARGDSIQQLADRVQGVFDLADRTRAERIARTEVQSAVNGAQITYAASLPNALELDKEWLATPDSRTRESHRQANGQRVPLGQAFDLGTEHTKMGYPGDPAGPPEECVNCRCTMLFVPPEPPHMVP